jgi:hypothetical protein
MIMTEMDPIEEELGKVGEALSVSPLVMKLDKFRILSDTDVPPEEFLMRLFGKPCFPRRDISTVTGTGDGKGQVTDIRIRYSLTPCFLFITFE